MTVTIPLCGFGTFQADPARYPPGTAKDAVLTALRTGYRHIDTAFAYGVEPEVGEAIKESGIPREELFVVTKLHNTFHDPADVAEGLERSLRNLKLDYIDLYLMHNPYAYGKGPNFATLRREDGSGKPVIDVETSRRYPETWKAMAKLVDAGKVRAIGLSNFNVLKTKRIVEETGLVPSANQVEMNPYFPQYALHDYCQKNNIQVIAHCPLGGALAPAVAGRKGGGPLDDSVISSIAHTHTTTPAAVVLAWLTQRGIAVVPKSANAERIKGNFVDGSLKLSEDEMRRIGGLMGKDGEKEVRNLDMSAHIGGDCFDESVDWP